MGQAFKRHSQFELLQQRRFLPFFVTQCFGAFNDNVFRQAIIGLLFWMDASPAQRTLYASLAPAIFILPYFLFSATAGQIAEKLEKSRLIRITTTMEIAIMSLAAVAFALQSLPLLLVALFLTGAQSTLFGPVKYSILPAVLRPEELTGGNGLVEMGTSVSILVGMIAGGMIFELAGAHGPFAAGGCVIALAVAGNLVSRMIPPAGAGAPDLKINWNPVPETFAVLRMARKQLAVRNAVLGISWFWFVGTVFATQLPDYAVLNLGGSATLYVFALALFSIGTGTGSMLCEKLSARTVEIGLVPLGAFGMSAFLFDLYFARSGMVSTVGLDVGGFLREPGSWRIVFDLVGIGVSTGLFVVPLFALVQARTPKHELSRTIGALNIQNSAFVVAASMICLALRQWAGWSIPQLFLALAAANTLVAIWIFSVVPEFLVRFLSWVRVRTQTRR